MRFTNVCQSCDIVALGRQATHLYKLSLSARALQTAVYRKLPNIMRIELQSVGTTYIPCWQLLLELKLPFKVDVNRYCPVADPGAIPWRFFWGWFLHSPNHKSCCTMYISMPTYNTNCSRPTDSSRSRKWQWRCPHEGRFMYSRDPKITCFTYPCSHTNDCSCQPTVADSESDRLLHEGGFFGVDDFYMQPKSHVSQCTFPSWHRLQLAVLAHSMLADQGAIVAIAPSHTPAGFHEGNFFSSGISTLPKSHTMHTYPTTNCPRATDSSYPWGPVNFGSKCTRSYYGIFWLFLQCFDLWCQN
jgi:hypothetical protein